jgi:hypothetical protein
MGCGIPGYRFAILPPSVELGPVEKARIVTAARTRPPEKGDAESSQVFQSVGANNQTVLFSTEGNWPSVGQYVDGLFTNLTLRLGVEGDTCRFAGYDRSRIAKLKVEMIL